jgi:hypothetical protein
MDRNQTQQMAELIIARRDLMARILKASVDQQAALADGLVEQLVSRLNEKQVMVDQLRGLQQQLKPLAETDPELREWPSETLRLTCRQAIAETEKLHAAVLEVDARCENEMVQRKDQLFEALHQKTGAATVAKAYNQSGAAGPRGGGFDLSSE